MKYWNFIQKFGLTLNMYQDENNTPHVRVYSNGCDPYVVNITFKHTAKQNRQYLTLYRNRFLERYLNKYEHKHGHLPKNMHYPVSPYYGGKSMAE